MRVGMLTGGGDCPGLNAVIRAVVQRGVTEFGFEVVGFLDGWRGLMEGHTMALTVEATQGLLAQGGTILGSSRTNPLSLDHGIELIKARLSDEQVDALIAIGGEDTLGVAQELHKHGVPVIGVPKTIDNDLSATDYTFGFDTAVNIATEAIDRLHTTAQSHHRALVVEVMGRHAGWIALHAGVAGGAHIILIPEVPFDVDQVIGWVEDVFRSSRAPIIAVAEGAHLRGDELITKDESRDAFGHVALSGVGHWLAEVIEQRTGREARTVVLGHLQRGGTPSAFDRVLATRLGLQAIGAVADQDWGTMVALQGTDIVRVSLSEATGTLKTVPLERYAEIEPFFGA